ncbi:MAG: hypothetical protein LBV52_02430 [Spirochaetaceae bacterium]|jgi:uncharacterized membrane protein|nr:hypothetical protein [Spirochaetaceae bacterium]
MKSIFKTIAGSFFYIIPVAYPVLVFILLVVYKLPLRIFSLFAIGFASVFFLFSGNKKKSNKFRIASAVILALLGSLCFFTNSLIILKLYPVLVNVLMLCVFTVTLFSPPCMIFRFATLQDKSIKGSSGEKKIEAYCKKVTVIWCCFFVINGSIAVYTVFFASNGAWSLYNGGISYILMGLLFIIEFLVRKNVQKKDKKLIEKMNKNIPDVKIVTQNEDSILLDFAVPSASPYFDGHFPQFKILPAVAQFELVMRLADRHFHCGIAPKKIKRMKFSGMISPDIPLRMELAYSKADSQIKFKISSPDGSKTYSCGGVQL